MNTNKLIIQLLGLLSLADLILGLAAIICEKTKIIPALAGIDALSIASFLIMGTFFGAFRYTLVKYNFLAPEKESRY